MRAHLSLGGDWIGGGTALPQPRDAKPRQPHSDLCARVHVVNACTHVFTQVRACVSAHGPGMQLKRAFLKTLSPGLTLSPWSHLISLGRWLHVQTETCFTSPPCQLFRARCL